ncbi:hypothetical protein NDU88_002059 [Pleurodeles waltl]|uniref:Uncharacterized protein n=1 Tax=Pleurodeles waltl TaxID=8319 RepID=A0AAV7V9I1_PLEWA|nr:hypothetical protein NDU88_002059 [Pleurodeles waltl]
MRSLVLKSHQAVGAMRLSEKLQGSDVVSTVIVCLHIYYLNPTEQEKKKKRLQLAHPAGEQTADLQPPDRDSGEWCGRHQTTWAIRGNVDRSLVARSHTALAPQQLVTLAAALRFSAKLAAVSRLALRHALFIMATRVATEEMRDL